MYIYYDLRRKKNEKRKDNLSVYQFFSNEYFLLLNRSGRTWQGKAQRLN